MQHINKIRTRNWLTPSSRLRSPVSLPAVFPLYLSASAIRHTVKPFSCYNYSALEPVPSRAYKVAPDEPDLEPASMV